MFGSPRLLTSTVPTWLELHPRSEGTTSNVSRTLALNQGHNLALTALCVPHSLGGAPLRSVWGRWNRGGSDQGWSLKISLAQTCEIGCATPRNGSSYILDLIYVGGWAPLCSVWGCLTRFSLVNMPRPQVNSLLRLNYEQT